MENFKRATWFVDVLEFILRSLLLLKRWFHFVQKVVALCMGNHSITGATCDFEKHVVASLRETIYENDQHVHSLDLCFFSVLSAPVPYENFYSNQRAPPPRQPPPITRLVSVCVCVCKRERVHMFHNCDKCRTNFPHGIKRVHLLMSLLTAATSTFTHAPKKWKHAVQCNQHWLTFSLGFQTHKWTYKQASKLFSECISIRS